MSNHLDREEFDAAIAEHAWDRLWDAYQYAVRGGEQSEVERLRAEVTAIANADLDVADRIARAVEVLGQPYDTPATQRIPAALAILRGESEPK